MLRSILIACALTLCVANDAASQAPEPPATTAGRVTVVGPAGEVAIGSGDLAAGRRIAVRREIHGAQHVFEGVAVSHLLARVGAPRGQALRGVELTNVVLITARDGYKVVLSLAETDSGMRAGAVILADKMDGAPLNAEDGPFRLVVEGDLRPARSARMVERIEVRRFGEERPPTN